MRSKSQYTKIYNCVMIDGLSGALRSMSDKIADQSSTRQGQQHILIIDDDPGIRSAMRKVLQMSGYRVSTASNMAESLAQARANREIEVLIVDHNLPNGERGADVVRSVRAILGHGTNAVLLTGDTSNAASEAGQTHGLQVFRKPIRLNQLLKLLHDFQEDRRAD
jgi:DNA-binding NtrC family response regulator